MTPIARRTFALSLVFASSLACGPAPEQPAPFALKFAALVDGRAVGCTDDLTGFGPTEAHHVGINDLRFYVSRLTFTDAAGNPVAATLDTNDFQYAAPEGSVALVDLTGNTEGSCAAASVAYAEGTGRTNATITGTTLLKQVANLTFDVGVPQGLMKKVIASSSPEGAPSPLNEMYWNWNSGYRHFVFNFSVQGDGTETGAGYVHLGSIDCAPEAGLALEDRDSCTFVNTPRVALSAFNLATDSIGLDLRRALAGVDFMSPIYEPTTFEVIGEGPGVECHSAPAQADCTPVFAGFGLDLETGAATASTNSVFVHVK